MENNTPIEQNSGQEDNSSTIFGTSSDAIIQGLHTGAFTDPEDILSQPDPGDDQKIVNEQEQHEIVNPDEEFTEKTLESSPATATAEENQGIADEVIEGDTVDDGIDNEEETLKKAN